ncbi:P-loop containing nucleoside triphosphate hydrolase protein [Daldinia bambusicola]|nr:P-loop containing nucleoside triphosphate hydrolase protein [Daldinia bambusicola]
MASDQVDMEKPTANNTHTKITVGEKCEFMAYHETVKHGQSTTVPAPGPFDGSSHSEDSAYALVVRRKFEEHRPSKVTLQINSPHIQKVFRDVIKSYIDVASDFTSTVELHGPFEMLAHYWDELDEYRESAADATTREHLDLLFEFMEYEIKPDRERALKMIQKQQIAYDNAWFIYRPGDILYTEVGGHPWLLVCKKTAYEEAGDCGPYLEIHCTYTDDDGIVAGQALHIESMLQRNTFPAGNPVSITELKVFPRRFIKEGDSLEQRVKLRGEKYLSLKDLSTMAYDGAAQWLKAAPHDFYDPFPSKFRGVWLPYTETGRIVLDRKTFGEEQRLAKAQVKKTDTEPLYCPPYTLGYSLGRKEWCRFYVDNLREAGWDPNAWDSLVLPDREKNLLKALISSHAYSKNVRDSMQQKGKGLVILLHGTPGSGKTLTAETAAEGSRKALMSTSVGELNNGSTFFHGSAGFERQLKKMLQYATIWQAVVLLDEADVFLEARKDSGDTERNALVAVLLKELEYFGGVVFLTTNRVGSFDIAMKSRIHMALTYTPPELEVRRRIWAQCLKKVPADARDIDIEGTVETLVTAKLNGREIANIVNTARTLARFDGAPLNRGHLETVVEVRQGFDEGLKNEGLR